VLGSNDVGADAGFEKVAVRVLSERKASRRRRASVSPPRIEVVAVPRPSESRVGTEKSCAGPEMEASGRLAWRSGQ
jgi:hypothetical protein